MTSEAFCLNRVFLVAEGLRRKLSQHSARKLLRVAGPVLAGDPDAVDPDAVYAERGGNSREHPESAAGLTSSYTGESIPAAATREHFAHDAERELALRPRRDLQIGSPARNA